MADVHERFNERLRRLARKHRALGRGYVMRLMPDGLVVAEPIKVRIKLPYRLATLLVVCLFVFKGFLLASLNTQSYEDRLVVLKEGTIVEQAGAWIMQPDRISMFIADRISSAIR